MSISKQDPQMAMLQAAADVFGNGGSNWQQLGQKRKIAQFARTAAKSQRSSKRWSSTAMSRRRRLVQENQAEAEPPLAAAHQAVTRRSSCSLQSAPGQRDEDARNENGRPAKTASSDSPELETREEELKQLQQIANDMSVKLESLDIEANRSCPDSASAAAVPTKNINATAALRHRHSRRPGRLRPDLPRHRLPGVPQSSAQRTRRGGRRPRHPRRRHAAGLSSRKALDPTHPIVAQLTESIDGVRTILMHDSTVETAASRARHQRRHDGRPHDRRQPVGRQPGPRRPPHAARRRRPAPPRSARSLRCSAGRRPVRSAARRSRRGRRHSSDARRRPVAAHGRLLRHRRDPRPGHRADAARVRQAPRRIRLHHHRRCPGPRHVAMP